MDVGRRVLSYSEAFSAKPSDVFSSKFIGSTLRISANHLNKARNV
jgi:hypothetical protein